MTFDNSPPPSASTWTVVKDHIPIVLLAGGVVAAFIGLHTALTTVAAIAGLHVVAGLLLLVGRSLLARRRVAGGR